MRFGEIALVAVTHAWSISAPSVGRCLFLKNLLEALQVVDVQVGYGPVGEVAVDPVEQVGGLAPPPLLRFAVRRGFWPNKQINEMLPLLVYQSSHRVVIEIVNPTAGQGKTLI